MVSMNSPHLNSIPKMWRRIDFNGYHSGYITTKIKPTKYGFLINRFSNYISLQSIKFETLGNGLAKATVKVDTNYRPKYQYTEYFKDLEPVSKQEFHELRKKI